MTGFSSGSSPSTLMGLTGKLFSSLKVVFLVSSCVTFSHKTTAFDKDGAREGDAFRGSGDRNLGAMKTDCVVYFCEREREREMERERKCVCVLVSV